MDALILGFTLFNKKVSFGIKKLDDGTFSLTGSVGTGLSIGYDVSVEGTWEYHNGQVEFTGISTKELFGLPSGSPLVLSFAPLDSLQSEVTVGIGINDWFDVSATISYAKLSGDNWNSWEFGNINELFDLEPNYANAESITSPIAIDLDADGVETTSLDQGVYFDHDGNGLAEKTAWISPDDGILAVDRNGDGRIDSGSELFGNNTKLSDGSLSANGYEALQEFDSNKDGLVDALDERYADLVIWRDLNQDGISQAGELGSLQDLGVSSISTGYQTNNITDESGNKILQSSSATLVDGSLVETADVWFQTDLSRTQTLDVLVLSEEIAALPNVIGFGNLHNLDQAMARDAELQLLVQSFVSSTDAQERSATLDNLIYQWAGVADVDPYSRDPSKVYGHVMDARQLETLEELVGSEYMGTWCWGERDPNPHGRAAPVLIAQYEQFKEFVSSQLMSQSHYADIFSEMGVRFDTELRKFVPDMTRVIVQLETLIEQSDLVEARSAYQVLEGLGIYSTIYQRAAEEVKDAGNLGDLLSTTLVEGSDASETLSGSSDADLIVGGAGNDYLLGRGGDDSYSFNLGDGSDRIYDNSGIDNIRFGQGIDPESIRFTRTATTLVLTHITDTGEQTGDRIEVENFFDFDGSISEGAIEAVYFAQGGSLTINEIIAAIEQPITEGADLIYGSDLDDSLTGLAGDDQLFGGAGDDTYHFGFGDGQDQIYENAGLDRLAFSQGVGLDNLRISRIGAQGEDILIELIDAKGQLTLDSIKIIKAYQGLEVSGNQVEQVSIYDTEGNLNVISIFDLVSDFSGGETNDLIYGLESADQIAGQDGDDQLHGAGGSDQMLGGAGDDRLFGESGDDWLSGGVGNDYLKGGQGTDTYFYALGDGDDLIDNRDVLGFDRLVFDQSVRSNRVSVSRIDDSLYLDINRGEGSVTLANYFDGDQVSDSALSEISFADGTALDTNQLVELTLVASQGDDFIQGTNGNDSLVGMAGNDSMLGGRGDDHLSGDQGADRLYGDTGQDVLLGGSGQDQLFGGQGEDRLMGGEQDDQLYGNSGADFLVGDQGDDFLSGGSQNDELYGGQGVDTLEGNSGDDQLFGGEGKDRLTGGLGNDVLVGGVGKDTYLYSRGDGRDRIVEQSKDQGVDQLSLEEFSIDEIWFSQRDDDLIVSFDRAEGEVAIEHWFSNPQALEEVEVEGFVAQIADVQRLVQAMAEFDAPSGPDQEIPLQTKQALEPMLAASWH